ncbi:unnamed protein product [Mycena citricolor]|uniref:Uncharacterized protein n=1 Tax=Mycena citricolor TaxID=2018698 RepID=A0AAD2HZE5_9AGAR|nr:unnamed protein product [Mycena citricolor]
MLALLPLLPLLPLLASAQTTGPTINTPVAGGKPGAAQCEPLLIQWTGGAPPYFMSVENTDTASTVVSFNNVNALQETWMVNVPTGTNLLLTVKDSSGTTGSSAPFQVVPGAGDSCLTSSGPPTTPASAPASSSSTAASSAGSAPSSNTGTGSATTQAAGTTAAPPVASTAQHTSTGSAASASARPSQTGGAEKTVRADVVVGIYAAVAMAGYVFF